MPTLRDAIDVGVYDLAGMRCDVRPEDSKGSLAIIDVNPAMQLSLRPYSYERFEIWAVCWDSAWAALKLFWAVNGMGKPTRAKLVKP